jgi:hypothetical protein
MTGATRSFPGVLAAERDVMADDLANTREIGAVPRQSGPPMRPRRSPTRQLAAQWSEAPANHAAAAVHATGAQKAHR